MKKTLAVLLALVMVLGCASAMAEYTLTTGSETGTYYGYSQVLAQYIAQNTDVKINVVPSDGSADNIERLDIGDAQLATVQNDVASYALNGVNTFEGAPVTSFTALAALYTEEVQIITCNPDIQSVADLKGKKVSIGAGGSGVYFNAVEILAAYDMTTDDIIDARQDFSQSSEALQDGTIDAAFIVAGAPTVAVTTLATAKADKPDTFHLVNLDDEHIEKLQGINPAYAKTVIPAGTYEGMTEDAVTVGIKATLIANGDVSDEDAYTIVSTIFENKDAIVPLHAKANALDLEYASVCGLPYNAGAAKYFAEKDITVETAE